jgi:hypothetical protein
MNWITSLYHQWCRNIRRRRFEKLQWQVFVLYMEANDALLKEELNKARHHLFMARDMSEFVE